MKNAVHRSTLRMLHKDFVERFLVILFILFHFMGLARTNDFYSLPSDHIVCVDIADPSLLGIEAKFLFCVCFLNFV